MHVPAHLGLVLAIALAFALLLFLGLANPRSAMTSSSPHAIADRHAPAPRVRSTSELTPVVRLPLVLNSYQFLPWTRLTFDPANDTQPALSPDEQTVVFISDRAGQPDVFRVPVTGGQVLNLTETPAAQEDTPVFSPDGSKIAFASNRSGDWDIYVMNPDGSNMQPAISYTGTDELHPSFTPGGSVLAFSSNRTGGNWDIYTAAIGSTTWTRLTTDPAVDRFPTLSANGATIAFRSERDGNSEVYLMDADGSNLRRVTMEPAYDGYPSIAPDGSGVAFISWRTGGVDVYGANPSGAGLVGLGHAPGWHTDTPRVTADGEALVYAARLPTGTFDVYLRPYTSPLYAIAERGASSLGGNCDWEAGVLAYGWIHAWRATGDNDYLRWAQLWIDGCIPLKTTITHVNDGLLGYAALAVYQAVGGAERLAFAQQVADYLLNTAPRTADGTLTHWDDTVWDDTLIGVAPFLVELSKVGGDSSHLDEAVAQVIRHADHLQNSSTGLYHHAWDESANSVLWPAYWARGNGWSLVADVEVLSAMPVTHTQHLAVLNIMQQHASALKSLQDSSGLWHTVVTRPDFYLETSASALIGYALQRGLQEGWLSASEYGATARAARLGVWRKVLADGTVTDVSAPTGPMFTEPEYNAIPHNALRLYGQGVALLTGSPSAP